MDTTYAPAASAVLVTRHADGSGEEPSAQPNQIQGAKWERTVDQALAALDGAPADLLLDLALRALAQSGCSETVVEQVRELVETFDPDDVTSYARCMVAGEVTVALRHERAARRDAALCAAALGQGSAL